MARQKPIPVPKRKKPAAEAKPEQAADAPNLDYIAETLRPLAVPVSELNFDPANAKKHGEGSISAIAASLKVYKQLKPVVARKDNGIVIAGNGTLQAALSLNWSHLAVVWVDMDAATAAGFSISDNRTAELSEWDKDALDALLREVNTNNDSRLDEMLAELATEMKIVPPDAMPEPGAGGDEFEVDKAMEGECRVQPGDKWVIGGYVAKCPKCSRMTKVENHRG